MNATHGKLVLASLCGFLIPYLGGTTMTVPMDPDRFFRDRSTDASGNRVLVGLVARVAAVHPTASWPIC
jgi:hypothetical protein